MNVYCVLPQNYIFVTCQIYVLRDRMKGLHEAQQPGWTMIPKIGAPDFKGGPWPIIFNVYWKYDVHIYEILYKSIKTKIAKEYIEVCRVLVLY